MCSAGRLAPTTASKGNLWNLNVKNISILLEVTITLCKYTIDTTTTFVCRGGRYGPAGIVPGRGRLMVGRHYFPTVDGQTRVKTLISRGRQLLTSHLPLSDIAFVKCGRGLRNTQEWNFWTFSHLYMKKIHLLVIH